MEEARVGILTLVLKYTDEVSVCIEQNVIFF